MARTFAKHVGALWRHKNEKVGEFLTGMLDLGGLGEVPIAVFKNDRKEKGKKHPDFRIVLSQRSDVSRKDAAASTEAEESMPY